MIRGDGGPGLRRFGAVELEKTGCPHAIPGPSLLQYESQGHGDIHAYRVTCPFCQRTIVVWESML